MAVNDNCNCNITDEELIEDINSSMLSSSQIDKISALFKVLGDPTRAKIVLALDNREVCVCTLADALGMTKSAVSHQLAILKANNNVFDLFLWLSFGSLIFFFLWFLFLLRLRLYF